MHENNEKNEMKQDRRRRYSSGVLDFRSISNSPMCESCDDANSRNHVYLQHRDKEQRRSERACNIQKSLHSPASSQRKKKTNHTIQPHQTTLDTLSMVLQETTPSNGSKTTQRPTIAPPTHNIQKMPSQPSKTENNRPF